MDDDFDPETLPDEIREALAEVFNLAAGVAELQLDQSHADHIYDLMGALAEYFGISVSVIPDQDQDLAVETRFVDASDTAPAESTTKFTITDKPEPDRDFGDNN